MTVENIINAGLEQLNVPHSQYAASKMQNFINLLLEKNKVVNLTSITLPEEAAEKHMLDCAAIAAHVPLDGKKIIDVGCGAGFPGVPLILLEQSYDITMLDSLQKRLSFIEETFRLMGESIPKTVHMRAEDAAHDVNFREQFDICLSRAVAPMNVLCELCLPYVKQGGTFVAMKSTSSDDEVRQAQRAITALGGTNVRYIDYTLPSGITHRLVLTDKASHTINKYPRKFAQIKKSPIS